MKQNLFFFRHVVSILVSVLLSALYFRPAITCNYTHHTHLLWRRKRLVLLLLGGGIRAKVIVEALIPGDGKRGSAVHQVARIASVEGALPGVSGGERGGGRGVRGVQLMGQAQEQQQGCPPRNVAHGGQVSSTSLPVECPFLMPLACCPANCENENRVSLN